MKGVSVMRAYRSSAWVLSAGTTRAIALITLGLATLLAFLAPRPSSGATPSKSASADTVVTDDGGFSVRVVEQTGDTKTTKVIKARKVGAVPPPVPAVPGVPPAPALPDEDMTSSDNDLVRFGEDITIPADKVIDGDVVAIGGNVTVYGRVKGDCTAIGGAVKVKGSGVIEGDAVSMGGGGVTISDSGSVAGSNVSLGSWNFEHAGHLFPLVGMFGAIGTGIWLLTTLIKLALTLLFAWLALLLARERLLYAVDTMGQRFGRSFLIGLAGWAGMIVTLPVATITIVLVCVIAAVILCVTIIGIPVAILLLIAMVLGIAGLIVAAVVAGFLGFMNGAMFLGRRILARSPEAAAKPLLAILVGFLVLSALKIAGKLIGVVGLLVFHPIAIALGIAAGALAVIVATAGLGAMILTGFRTGPGAPGGSQWWSPFPPRPAAAPASPAAPAAAVSPAPSSPPPPEGGTSDAP
jgi:hypothetical protein